MLAFLKQTHEDSVGSRTECRKSCTTEGHGDGVLTLRDVVLYGDQIDVSSTGIPNLIS